MRTRRAAAPCHQPNLAPVTIHACWYSQWRSLAAVGPRELVNQASRSLARAGSEISSRGSFGAPGAVNAAGRRAFGLAARAVFLWAGLWAREGLCALTTFFALAALAGASGTLA